jgi:hypothetical protein
MTKTQLEQSCKNGIKVFVGSKIYTPQFYQILLGLQKWVVADLPPLKESCPEIRKLRLKEIRELAPKIILSLPSCFIFRVIAPLDLEKLDLAPSGESDGFFQDMNWSLTIG